MFSICSFVCPRCFSLFSSTSLTFFYSSRFLSPTLSPVPTRQLCFLTSSLNSFTSPARILNGSPKHSNFSSSLYELSLLIRSEIHVVFSSGFCLPFSSFFLVKNLLIDEFAKPAPILFLSSFLKSPLLLYGRVNFFETLPCCVLLYLHFLPVRKIILLHHLQVSLIIYYFFLLHTSTVFSLRYWSCCCELTRKFPSNDS